MGRKEVQRHQNERQHTAIEEGKSLRTYRVVGAEIHLGQHIQKIKLLRQRNGRIGEGGLTEGQRIVSGQKDRGADADHNQ